jgi:hypothetical protein
MIVHLLKRDDKMDNETIQKLFEQILQAARARGMTPTQCRAKAHQNFGFLWLRLWENAAQALEAAA